MFYRGSIQRRKLLKPRSHKKKNANVSHPDWDNTVQDLTVHAASPEEVLQRKLRRKSKNVDAARREIAAKKKGLPVDLLLSPGQVELEMKKLAVLREVLYDHNDLNEVLRRTDRTMASVKDIFHDSTNRKSGHPNITLAPGGRKQAPPVHTAADQPSKLDALSDSVMDNQALNEGHSSSEESEYEDDVQFESKVDYERFMNLLKDSMNNKPTDVDKTPDNDRAAKAKMKSALNCTEEVKRTLSRISPIREIEDEEKVDDQKRKIDETISSIVKDASKLQKKLNNSTATTVFVQPRPSHQQCNMTYDDLQGAMTNVEKNLAAFEERTGRTQNGVQVTPTSGLAGFTATLIDAVTRLTTYVNEGEIKMQEMTKKNEEIMSKMDHQKAMNEALAMELLNTQKVIKQNQEKIKTLEEESKKEEEEKKVREEMMKIMEERIEDLTQSIHEVESKIVISENTIIERPENPSQVETIEEQNDQVNTDEDVVLKGDMIRLLTALKSQNEKAATPRMEHSPPKVTSLITDDTHEAAQTIASVESHLRHLKLQHAEAQQRMDELTRQAQVFSHTTSSFPPPGTSSDTSITLPVNLPSNPSQRSLQQANVTIPSSVPYSLSPPSHDIYQPIEPRANVIHKPAVQTNDDFMDFDSDVGSFKFLERDTTESESNISISSSVSSPQIAQQQKVVLNSIQRTQISLEDRICELNKQHSEAQGRLQKLVARRRNGGEQKKVQVSMPSVEMLETPRVSRKPTNHSTDAASAPWHALSSYQQ